MPDNGQVLADGKPVTEPGRDRMVMFQESALFPWLDVMENVMFGLKLKPNSRTAERREVARFYFNWWIGAICALPISTSFPAA